MRNEFHVNVGSAFFGPSDMDPDPHFDYTVCPGSLSPIYIVSYNPKWVKTDSRLDSNL